MMAVSRSRARARRRRRDVAARPDSALEDAGVRMDRDGLTVVPEAVPSVAASPVPVRTAPDTTSTRHPFRALRSTPFRLYFAGQVASASGTFVQQTATGWLVLQLTGSAASLGLVLAAGGLPSLLLGPFGGSLADRVDLRRLPIVTQLVFGVLAAALWAVAASGAVSVAVIVALTVAGGFVQIIDSPARQAFVPSLVSTGDLASAVSLNGVVMNSARVVGPAVAGTLIATVGTTPCFAVNAFSYAAVVAALIVVRPLARPAKPRAGTGNVRDAVRYASRHEQLWVPLAMMSIVGLLAFNFGVVLPVLAQQTFHGTGGTYGLLSTMLSIGSVLGSLAVGFIGHPRRIYLLAAVSAFGVCLALSALAPNVPFACAALFVTGLAGFCFVTLASTTLQLHADPAYRGRIMALWVLVYLGTTPVGSVLSGWVCSFAGPRGALWVGVLACALAAGLAARVHTPPNPDRSLEQREHDND